MEREHRYYVAKTKDVEKYLSDEQQLSLDRFLTKIRIGRLNDGKADVKTVCVDSDWPEYETVWKMIEARVDGKASPASVPEGREAVIEAVAESLGDAYDCTRVWSAWGYRTMSEDDFSRVAEDRSRLEEIADAALAASPTPPVSEDRKDAENSALKLAKTKLSWITKRANYLDVLDIAREANEALAAIDALGEVK